MNLKKGKFLGAIVLSLFLLSSCRSLRNSNNLFQSRYDKFADTAKSIYIANENVKKADNTYKIRAFDLITIRNIQNPNGPNPPADGAIKATLYRLDKEGIVSLPAIGAVDLMGLSQSEATVKIQNLYSKSLLKDPLIELIVTTFKVTILGEVSKPGNYLMERENISLIDILGESGGLKSSADVKRIKIIRGDLKNPEIIYANLKNLNTLSSDKLILQNNDIIYIPNKSLIDISEGISSYLNLL